MHLIPANAGFRTAIKKRHNMKKILLSAFCALCAFGASADYSQYFKVVYEGNVVADNSEVIVAPTDAFEGYCDYMPHLNVVAAGLDSQNVYVAMEYTGTPSEADTKADPDWGGPQMCFEGSFNDKQPNACLQGGGERFVASSDDVILPPSDLNTFFLMPEVIGQKEDKVSKYKVSVIALDENKDELDDAVFTCTVVFTANGAGVGEIGVDNNAAPVYYNLQGVKVANPGNGVFIKSQGGKVSKVILN